MRTHTGQTQAASCGRSHRLFFTTLSSLPLALLALPAQAQAQEATEAASGLGGLEVLLIGLLLVVLLLLKWTDHRPRIPWRRFQRPRTTLGESEEFTLTSFRVSLGREPTAGEVFSQTESFLAEQDDLPGESPSLEQDIKEPEAELERVLIA